MLFEHSESGRRLRLGYCMNLHPAETVEGVIEAMRRVTIPLAERLGNGEPFGVGMYFPARLAAELVEDPGGLDALGSFLHKSRLDPFTYNAFPAGGFGSKGLKERVFEPTWLESARSLFTSQVAQIAAKLSAATDFGSAASHVSISTHTGMHSSQSRGQKDQDRCARKFARAAQFLANIEAEGAPRMVLSLEAEPRANCNDTRELVQLLARVRELSPELEPILVRHLGACLDACHSAVEFETPSRAVERATELGPLGKLQFSSALALPNPAADAAGRAALLAMDEPAYLHQVTGSPDGSGSNLQRTQDLPDLREALASEQSPWLESSEWRCHFHVPVDLAEPLEGEDAGALTTTRNYADQVLDELQRRPARWGTDELHVEIETYTWDLLGSATRGQGDLVDGLQREYEHVLARLAGAGWIQARSS